MDPVGGEFVRSAIAHQGALLGHQASQLSSTTQEVEILTAQLAELSSRLRELQHNVLSSSASAALLPQFRRDREPEPHANNPLLYDGDPNSCWAFLFQCSLVFTLQPRRYATERLKIAYVITLLTRRAREWVTAVWARGASFCNDFEEFRCKMTRLFDRLVRVMRAVLVLPLPLCLLCYRLRQLISPGYRRSTWICGWFSAGPESPRFPPTDRSIMPSMSSQALLRPGAISFPISFYCAHLHQGTIRLKCSGSGGL